jgi:hypothetical protein
MVLKVTLRIALYHVRSNVDVHEISSAADGRTRLIATSELANGRAGYQKYRDRLLF